jgi:hypothetical protein
MVALSVSVNVTDKSGNTTLATANATIADAVRFPGDPGIGKLRMGLNNVAGFAPVEAQMPKPLSLHRIYNNGNWGVNTADIQIAINKGQVPLYSWGFVPFTVSTVPQASINTLVDSLKSFAPNPIWCVASLHEPENDLTTAAQAASFRTLQRQIITTARSRGVTNVAWCSPSFMRFTFTAGSGRDWRWWHAEWNGGNTKTAADFDNGWYDFDAMDIYVPLIGSTTWRAPSLQMDDALIKMRADGYTPKPLAIAELGVQSDTDLTVGPTNMQDAYNGLLQRNGVGVGWWTTGQDSFCHGPAPANDPGCFRENKLKDLANDLRTV